MSIDSFRSWSFCQIASVRCVWSLYGSIDLVSISAKKHVHVCNYSKLSIIQCCARRRTCESHLHMQYKTLPFCFWSQTQRKPDVGYASGKINTRLYNFVLLCSGVMLFMERWDECMFGTSFFKVSHGRLTVRWVQGSFSGGEECNLFQPDIYAYTRECALPTYGDIIVCI